jgi:phosphohistidine phosphatase
MYLYLVRHGEANPKEIDPERHLSEKGMEEVSEMAAFAKCARVKVDEIWHSTKERARRTAIILAEAVPHKNIVEREGLSPNDPITGIASEIDKIHENIMIVGHLPFLDLLAAKLSTGAERIGTFNFRAAAVVCLEKWEQGWSVSWMMDPEMLRQCMKD